MAVVGGVRFLLLVDLLLTTYDSSSGRGRPTFIAGVAVSSTKGAFGPNSTIAIGTSNLRDNSRVVLSVC